MAEVTVSSLLLKLGDVVLQKAITLYGVKDKVEKVKKQLVDIQCFLKDADSQRNNSESTARNWVKQVRNVSFMIEDAIDTFLLEVESLSEKERNLFRISVKWMTKWYKKLAAMNRFDAAINKIQATIDEINKNKTSFRKNDQVVSASNLGSLGSLEISTLVIPEDEKIDLVGFSKEKKDVERDLLDEDIKRQSVVFITGIGGLGKTTLAKKVYQSVQDKFDFHIRLTVSKEFKQIDLLKKILEKAGIETDNEAYHLINIKEHLKGKKYFILLDDVHSKDVWPRMKDALPDDGNGSRILITTRTAEIVTTADIRSVHRLGFLSQNESIQLLFKRALPEHNYTEGSYPHDLHKVVTVIAEKCGGLPLAIVLVGGQLSIRRPPTYHKWKSVMETMNWDTDGEDCTNIFSSSYEDLPVYLRSCFMYFALFPEDYEYTAEFLTWLWIAEGFIRHDEPGTKEEIANKYLRQLARRCMIDVSKRSLDGSILNFRVQKLLHGFAIREAEEKDFVKVLLKEDNLPDNGNSVRRLTSQLNDSNCVVNSSQENKFNPNINPTIRTLILFGKMVPFSSQFTLLRVLVIFHYNGHLSNSFPSLLLITLKKVLQLKCLAFIECNFPWEIVLPIEHLHKLITLVIRSCQNILVPSRSLWEIKTLRHVLVDRAYNFCDTLQGVSKPVDVPDLQTLEEVKINKPEIKWLITPNLLKLHLINEDNSWESIRIMLLNQPKLGSLTLESNEVPLEIINTRIFPSYECLHTLCLKGRWELKGVELSAEMFPPLLTMLTLASSNLDQKSLQVLEKLECLKILVLYMAYVGGEKMILEKGGFCGLEHLTLAMLKIKKLEIVEGAVPKLNHLEIDGCLKLQMVPELKHVKTLKILSLRNMPVEFKSMVENGDNINKKTCSINYYE